MNNHGQTMWRFLVMALVSSAIWLLHGPVGADAAGEGVAPDIAIVADGVGDASGVAVVAGLSSIDGVGRATVDSIGEGSLVFYIDDSGTGTSRPVSAIASQARDIIAAELPDADVLVGGSALVDQDLSGHFDVTTLAIVALAGAIGGLLGIVFGWKRGLAVGAASALAVFCAGNIAGQVGGGFDGTMTTTSVPGALAGLVVAVTLSLRLLIWFRTPSGVDGAETIRHSISGLLPELALLFSGSMLAAVPVELLNPGRSPLTVVAISGLVAAVVILAAVAPALTVLRDEPEASARLLPLSVLDGRDFPLVILAAIGLVLAALSLFAFRDPATALLDAEALPDDSEPAIVASRLLVGGGDATTALVATKPAATSQVDFEGWAVAIVERAEVERVDIASGRFLSTGQVAVEDTTLLLPAGAEGVAVIVLNVSPRSEVGQEVTSRLAATPLAGGRPGFTGEAADAADVAGSSSPVIVAIIALAVAGAVSVQVLTQNTAQSAVTLLLRLIGGGATVGVYRLMIPNATMSELLIVLALIAIGVGLFELEFLQDLTGKVEEGRVAGQEAGRRPNPGQNGAFGLVALGLGGLTMAPVVWLGGGPGTGRFGLGLLAAVMLEVLIGVLVLRPALLGQRAAFHTAVRPVRVAIHSGTDRGTESSNGPEDPTWRRVVGDLLQAEFRLQSQPAEADLEAVFVRDTPLYRQAATHHDNLAGAGLRIVGRSPRLRSLKTVTGRSPITLAVTVDHPERQLVDATGNVVGVRKAERRSGVLWLHHEPDGSFRIAESVELGSTPLPTEGEESAVSNGGDALVVDDIAAGGAAGR